jgi:hypothetical protein
MVSHFTLILYYAFIHNTNEHDQTQLVEYNSYQSQHLHYNKPRSNRTHRLSKDPVVRSNSQLHSVVFIIVPLNFHQEFAMR